MNWITEHWDDVLTVYGGIVAICTVIVKITPTTKDNTILDKIVKIVDLFSTAYPKGSENGKN